VEEVLRARGTQRDIEVWFGLGFEIEQVKNSFPDKDNPGKQIEFYVTTPVRFLGVKDGVAKPTSSKASAAVEKAKAKAAEKKAAAEANGNGDGLREKLLQLAKESENHEAFVAAAFELDGVDGGPLEDAVLDESQLFTEARA